MATRAPAFPLSPPADIHELARRYRLPVANLNSISSQAVSLVPERWARRFNVVPLSATEHELVLATSDPLDVDCERTLAFATGRNIRFAVAEATEIARCVDGAYGGGDSTDNSRPDSILEVQHLHTAEEAAPPTPNE